MTIPIEKTGSEKYIVSPDGPAPRGIVLHHSFSQDGKTRDWDGIRKYHMSFRYQGDIISEKQYDEYKSAGRTSGLERPWKDVAYHLGIERVNNVLTVQKGRPIKSAGAHTVGLDEKGLSFNSYYIGVCVVGCFDVTPPDPETVLLLITMCRDLCKMFGFTAKYVVGHRETFTVRGVPIEKSCPGASWDLDAFRKRLTI